MFPHKFEMNEVLKILKWKDSLLCHFIPPKKQTADYHAILLSSHFENDQKVCNWLGLLVNHGDSDKFSK